MLACARESFSPITYHSQSLQLYSADVVFTVSACVIVLRRDSRTTGFGCCRDELIAGLHPWAIGVRLQLI
jgi:hypothetical protein